MLIFSIKSIFVRKARTFLIALSVAIGVISVLIIDSISSSGAELINAELDSLGISGFSVSRASAKPEEKLNNKDLQSIKDVCYIENATPIITTTGYLKSDLLPSAIFCGIDQNAGSIISLEKVLGDDITDEDVLKKSQVCLIDQTTKNALFGEASSGVGEEIDVLICDKNITFKIIGIVQSGSSILQTSIGEMLPSVIYVPYTSLQKIIGNDSIDQIALNASAEYLDSAFLEESINNAIADSEKQNKIKINDLNKGRDDLNLVLDVIKTVLKLIGGISLLVSGLGITTVMLMSVGERKREIGIKKSIGARKTNIAFEFMSEAVLITFLGSLIGNLFSYITIFTLKNVANIPLSFNFKLAFFISFIAVICGIIFSVYPVFKAASLKPIDALKEDF